MINIENLRQVLECLGFVCQQDVSDLNAKGSQTRERERERERERVKTAS